MERAKEALTSDTDRGRKVAKYIYNETACRKNETTSDVLTSTLMLVCWIYVEHSSSINVK